jgi:ADP-ribosylglycohydrolase
MTVNESLKGKNLRVPDMDRSMAWHARTVHQEALEQWKGRPLTREEERELDRMHGMTDEEVMRQNRQERYFTVLNAYRRGDCIGQPWEGAGIGPLGLTYDRITSRKGSTSDETDIVECFVKFTGAYRFTDVDQLLLDWCEFHYRNYKVTGYGRSYSDHFRLMKWLDRKGETRLDTIRSVARDRNSFGNGCLALVYPVHCYAKDNGLPAWDLVEAFTRLVYAHPVALAAVRLLNDLIETAEGGGDPFDVESGDPYVRQFLGHGITLPVEEFIRTYPDSAVALHALFHALYGAHGAASEEEVIVKTVNLGGDADSVLATAMLIWTLKDMRLQDQAVAHGEGDKP